MEPKPVNGGVRDTAKAIGVSPALIVRKRKQGKSDEQIMLEAETRRERLSDRAMPRGPDGVETYSKAQERKESALADLRELELAKEMGLLIDREQAREAWSAMISQAKSSFLTIADELCDRLATETNPIACREMLESKIHEALAHLAEYPASA